MKSFHGAVEVNAATAKARLMQIAEKVINVLTSDPLAKVTVNLEVSAEFSNGAAEQVCRAGSEKAANLKLRLASGRSMAEGSLIDDFSLRKLLAGSRDTSNNNKPTPLLSRLYRRQIKSGTTIFSGNSRLRFSARWSSFCVVVGDVGNAACQPFAIEVSNPLIAADTPTSNAFLKAAGALARVSGLLIDLR